MLLVARNPLRSSGGALSQLCVRRQMRKSKTILDNRGWLAQVLQL
jgi:hypothetical protein